MIVLVGIGFVAMVTAFVADRFIRTGQEVEAREDLLLTELRDIKRRLGRLEQGRS